MGFFGLLKPNANRTGSQKNSGMLNLRGVMLLKFLAIRSPKLTGVAWTRIRTSLSFGAGFATSARCSTSGDPYSV